MSTWINFKELRAKLDFEHVLRHYQVEVKRKGTQHHGFCPLPNHNGKKNSPSFSANLDRGIFQCFGCGAKGNVLEFAALMEGVDPGDGPAFRAVALGLQEKLCGHVETALSRLKKGVEPPAAAVTKPVVAIVNAPLDFELKGLDQSHPYLKSRGFSPETIASFGIGFCSRGVLKDRVAIPLKDQFGRLIGYAGRVVDDSTVSEENPRYRFPAKREREGKVFEFKKTFFLYNGYRIPAPVDHLIVVEGFTSVWWLRQNRFPNVVATMGADVSERQIDLLVHLVRYGGRVTVLSDGDDAGKRFGEKLVSGVSLHRFVRWVKSGEKKQPTDYSGEELFELISW